MDTVQRHAQYLGKGWSEFLAGPLLFAEENIYPTLSTLRRKGVTIYPEQSNIYKAFINCPIDELKVVILGQD